MTSTQGSFFLVTFSWLLQVVGGRLFGCKESTRAVFEAISGPPLRSNRLCPCGVPKLPSCGESATLVSGMGFVVRSLPYPDSGGRSPLFEARPRTLNVLSPDSPNRRSAMGIYVGLTGFDPPLLLGR